MFKKPIIFMVLCLVGVTSVYAGDATSYGVPGVSTSSTLSAPTPSTPDLSASVSCYLNGWKGSTYQNVRGYAYSKQSSNGTVYTRAVMISPGSRDSGWIAGTYARAGQGDDYINAYGNGTGVYGAGEYWDGATGFCKS